MCRVFCGGDGEAERWRSGKVEMLLMERTSLFLGGLGGMIYGPWKWEMSSGECSVRCPTIHFRVVKSSFFPYFW